MQEKEPLVGRRLLAVMVDVILLVAMAFFFNAFVSQPIMNATSDMPVVVEKYKEDSSSYSSIQDEYGIYYLDSDGKRTYNSSVTEETKENFLNDTRVIELKEKLVQEQSRLLWLYVGMISMSIGFAAAISYLILPLCLRRGRTLGKLFLKLDIIDKKTRKYITWPKCLLRYFISIVVNVYLGVVSAMLIPLGNLLVSVFTKDNQAVEDLCSSTIVVDGQIPYDMKLAALEQAEKI